MDRTGKRLTGRALTQRVVLAMIKRRAAAAGLKGRNVEHAEQIAGHASPKTTRLYDRLRAQGIHFAPVRYPPNLPPVISCPNDVADPVPASPSLPHAAASSRRRLHRPRLLSSS